MSSTIQTPSYCEVCWTALENSDGIKMPCKHSWCKDCLINIFSNVKNDSQWPIHCCSLSNVPLETAKPHLPTSTLAALEKKLIELATEPSKRLWCSNKNCRDFISLDKISKSTAICHACSTKTCTNCRNTSHEGDCKVPEDEIEVFKLLREEGYMQCSRCQRTVERNGGCPHMTCLCGYEFCYHCGEQINECNGCWHLEPEDEGDEEQWGDQELQQDGFGDEEVGWQVSVPEGNTEDFFAMLSLLSGLRRLDVEGEWTLVREPGQEDYIAKL